ncbi:MAG: hypothetical protein HZA64_06940 [Rhodocyclales bacterium]|nr:hypothetical protein [Rhodocyclales bacterium]
MSVASEVVGLLERLAAAAPMPRVRGLHLPPADKRGEKEGEFCALELDGGVMGLSYMLLGDTRERLAELDATGLRNADALQVARWYATEAGVRRTVGFAAANALCRWFFDRAGFVPDASRDSIGELDPAPGDRIGMIGHFGRLIERIVATGAELTVIELRADLVGDYPGYRVTLDPGALAGCNKVLSTSTVLLNDSLEAILANCRAARYFAMVGPGAGGLPDPLFARGVTLLGGTRATDPDAFRAALLAGESWSLHTSKFALAPTAYPGFEALLTRL